MFGQGFFPVPDFCDGAGVEGAEGVGAVGVVDLAAVVVALVLLGAAAAPAMPETAPAVARAPATIVAPSILDIVIAGRTSLGRSIAYRHP
jgi:hypothetical protein